jgi:hypothetical protein
MLKRNKNFDGIIKQLNNEYKDVVLHNWTKNMPTFNYVDFADAYSKDSVTYGDSFIDDNGLETPLELILTADHSFLSR